MGKLFQTREEIRQKMLKDIEDDKIRDDYRISKNQYKNKYRRVIIDIEKLNLEKEIVESQMYRQSLPYFSLVISVGIATMGTLFGLLSSFIQSGLGDTKVLPKILIPSAMFSVCMLVVFIFAYKIYQVLENGDLRSKEYYIRLKALKELEKELLENGELKNYSSEASEEVAATQVELNDSVCNKVDKEKRTKIIKGLFKKKSRFEKDKKSQEELAQEFEKLKSLNQEELITRKGWYNREAKIQRDNAFNIKEWNRIVATIITILGIIVTMMMQVYNTSHEVFNNAINAKINIIEQKDKSDEEKEKEIGETYTKALASEGDVSAMNKLIEFIVRVTFVSLAFLIAISIFVSSHNDKASQYETLAQYIDSELLKDK